MVLRGATSLLGALEGVGPENWDFFGPWNGTSEVSAIWAQKSLAVCEKSKEKLNIFAFLKAKEFWKFLSDQRMLIDHSHKGHLKEGASELSTKLWHFSSIPCFVLSWVGAQTLRQV